MACHLEQLRNRPQERVDHPAHYCGADNPFETIKVIEAWGLGFNLGNAVKYLSRAGRKDATAMVEDLKKAAWYLDRELTCGTSFLARKIPRSMDPYSVAAAWGLAPGLQEVLTSIGISVTTVDGKRYMLDHALQVLRREIDIAAGGTSG